MRNTSAFSCLAFQKENSVPTWDAKSFCVLAGRPWAGSLLRFKVRCGAPVPIWNRRATGGFWQAIGVGGVQVG